jgi:flagellar basal body-associated protein FliL
MSKKTITILSVLVILAFIGYMIIDFIKPARSTKADEAISNGQDIVDAWKISGEFKVNEGSLKAVSVAPSGNIFLGGDSFVSCYSNKMQASLEC